jgi:zinc transport system ATP-binding protein
MNNMSVINIKDVNFSYDGIRVLEKVNLEIQQKEFLSMVGPNGGGKTTLLKIILGLLKPNSGTVSIFGTSSERARDRIGYMPQHMLFDPHFPVSVMDVVLMGRLSDRLRGSYSKADKKAVMEALDEVEMTPFYKQSFSALSGGQKQRILLSRALVGRPELLLLDEPTANVDLEIEQKLYGILKELNRRMTIIMVTHDLGFVSHMVQRVICVKKKVVIHPVSKINGKLIKEIYGHEIRMVRHDHITDNVREKHG